MADLLTRTTAYSSMKPCRWPARRASVAKTALVMENMRGMRTTHRLTFAMVDGRKDQGLEIGSNGINAYCRRIEC
jgi:hypothetical protein